MRIYVCLTAYFENSGVENSLIRDVELITMKMT